MLVVRAGTGSWRRKGIPSRLICMSVSRPTINGISIARSKATNEFSGLSSPHPLCAISLGRGGRSLSNEEHDWHPLYMIHQTSRLTSRGSPIVVTNRLQKRELARGTPFSGLGVQMKWAPIRTVTGMKSRCGDSNADIQGPRERVSRKGRVREKRLTTLPPATSM